MSIASRPYFHSYGRSKPPRTHFWRKNRQVHVKRAFFLTNLFLNFNKYPTVVSCCTWRWLFKWDKTPESSTSNSGKITMVGHFRALPTKKIPFSKDTACVTISERSPALACRGSAIEFSRDRYPIRAGTNRTVLSECQQSRVMDASSLKEACTHKPHDRGQPIEAQKQASTWHRL